MTNKATKGIRHYIFKTHFKNPHYIRKNMKIKLIFTTLVDDNKAGLKFSLQRVFKSGY